MKKHAAFLLAFFCLLSFSFSAFAAKNNEEPAPTAEPIPEPTLSPDAADYDPERRTRAKSSLKKIRIRSVTPLQ